MGVGGWGVIYEMVSGRESAVTLVQGQLWWEED